MEVRSNEGIEAFEKGLDCAISGGMCSDNPFPSTDPLHKDWADGYQAKADGEEWEEAALCAQERFEEGRLEERIIYDI